MSETEKLKELKRKWDEDYFGLDSAGVYGVEEAMDEASEHLSMYDRRPPAPKGGIYDWQGTQPPQTSNNEASRVFERKGEKTCRICHRARVHNDPCDSCYKMVRAAAEWTDGWGTMEVYPCAMCDTEVYSTICGTCMDTMLGE